MPLAAIPGGISGMEGGRPEQGKAKQAAPEGGQEPQGEIIYGKLPEHERLLLK